MKKITSFLYVICIQWLLQILAKIKGFDQSFPIDKPTLTRRGILLWYLRTIKPLFGIDVQYKKDICSNQEIDVVIPAIDKDFDMLTLVIDSIYEHIKHPIGRIYIIAPKSSDKIRELSERKKCSFIDENTLCPVSKENIQYNYNGLDRSGWLYQQLLKLSADKISTSQNILICDADTFFLRDKVYEYKGKYILDHSIEHHKAYYEVYSKILRRRITSNLSCICHNMLFKRDWLIELKHEIESVHNKEWWKVILEQTDYSSISGFSEYETYGNYVLTKHRSMIRREFWWNKASMDLNNSNAIYYKSQSCHSYLRE